MNKRSIFLTLFCMERIDFFSFIIFYKSFFMKVFFFMRKFLLLAINPTKGHDKPYFSTHYQGINQVERVLSDTARPDSTVLASRRTKRQREIERYRETVTETERQRETERDREESIKRCRKEYREIERGKETERDRSETRIKKRF